MESKLEGDDDFNLKVIRSHNNFTKWMYEEVSQFLSGGILEVGSGVGTYSERLARDNPGSSIVISDIDSSHIRFLKERFSGLPNVKVVKIDLNSDDDFKNLRKKFDTVACLNVLEHVEDDVAALKRMKDVLKSGGRLVLLVPAHKFLYNIHDRSIGHFRRYTKAEIEKKAREAGLKIEKMFYFNFLSIFGWYLYGNVLKRVRLSEGAFGIFDYLVPLLKLFERYVLMRRMGLSIIVVMKKGYDA